MHVECNVWPLSPLGPTSLKVPQKPSFWLFCSTDHLQTGREAASACLALNGQLLLGKIMATASGVVGTIGEAEQGVFGTEV